MLECSRFTAELKISFNPALSPLRPKPSTPSQGEARDLGKEISALERSEYEDSDIEKRAMETAHKVRGRCVKEL